MLFFYLGILKRQRARNHLLANHQSLADHEPLPFPSSRGGVYAESGAGLTADPNSRAEMGRRPDPSPFGV